MVQIIVMSAANMPVLNKIFGEGVNVPFVKVLALQAVFLSGAEKELKVESSIMGEKYRVEWEQKEDGISILLLMDQSEQNANDKQLRFAIELLHRVLVVSFGEKLKLPDLQVKKLLKQQYVDNAINLVLQGLREGSEQQWFADITGIVDHTLPASNQADIQKCLEEYAEVGGAIGACMLIENVILQATDAWNKLEVLDNIALIALSDSNRFTGSSSSISVWIPCYGVNTAITFLAVKHSHLKIPSGLKIGEDFDVCR